MITLQALRPTVGARKARKRLGRGIGSGTGKTAGKGHKGQTARKGGKIPCGFEGGQTPLYRRLPKRGFRNTFRVEYEVLPVHRLNCFATGTEVNVSMLEEKGLATLTGKKKKLKILGGGELDRSLLVSAHKFSRTAQETIEKSGGQCREL